MPPSNDAPKNNTPKGAPQNPYRVRDPWGARGPVPQIFSVSSGVARAKSSEAGAVTTTSRPQPQPSAQAQSPQPVAKRPAQRPASAEFSGAAPAAPRPSGAGFSGAVPQRPSAANPAAQPQPSPKTRAAPSAADASTPTPRRAAAKFVAPTAPEAAPAPVVPEPAPQAVVSEPATPRAARFIPLERTETAPAADRAIRAMDPAISRAAVQSRSSRRSSPAPKGLITVGVIAAVAVAAVAAVVVVMHPWDRAAPAAQADEDQPSTVLAPVQPGRGKSNPFVSATTPLTTAAPVVAALPATAPAVRAKPVGVPTSKPAAAADSQTAPATTADQPVTAAAPPPVQAAPPPIIVVPPPVAATPKPTPPKAPPGELITTSHNGDTASDGPHQ